MARTARRQANIWESLDDWLIIEEPDKFQSALPRAPRTIRQNFRLIDGSLDRRADPDNMPTEAAQFAYMITTSPGAAQSVHAEKPITWQIVLATIGGLIVLLVGILGVTLVAIGLRSAPYIGICYLIPIGLWTIYVGLRSATSKLESI
jgi:hypothetical protein